MFIVTIGEEGLSNSWQADFPKEVKCNICGGDARVGFVVFENYDDEDPEDKTVSDLYKNDPENTGYWLHDVCAVAVYFCKECLEPVAEYNQA